VEAHLLLSEEFKVLGKGFFGLACLLELVEDLFLLLEEVIAAEGKRFFRVGPALAAGRFLEAVGALGTLVGVSKLEGKVLGLQDVLHFGSERSQARHFYD